MDTTNSVLLGIAGTGLIVTLGYGIYQGQKKTKSIHPSQIPQNSALHAEEGSRDVLPIAETRNPENANSKPILQWKHKYNAQHVKNDTVLFNALDSLSVYGHADEQTYLDIVHFVEQFCILYEMVQKGSNNYSLLKESTKIQIKLFNAIGALEKNIFRRYPIEQQSKIKRDFQDRAQLIVDILNGYHVNIIREMNSK